MKKVNEVNIVYYREDDNMWNVLPCVDISIDNLAVIEHNIISGARLLPTIPYTPIPMTINNEFFGSCICRYTDISEYTSGLNGSGSSSTYTYYIACNKD